MLWVRSESGFIGFEDLQDLIILGLTDKSRNNEPRRSEGREDKRV